MPITDLDSPAVTLLPYWLYLFLQVRQAFSLSLICVCVYTHTHFFLKVSEIRLQIL